MRISVIMVTLNSAQHVETAIKSYVGQVYEDKELIVVDGRSYDGTMEILGRYSEYVDHIICEKDEGIYDAINKGLRLASGDVIGTLHSDDFYPDNVVLKKIAQEFQETHDLTVAYGDLQYVDKRALDNVKRYWVASLPGNINFGWMPPHPAMFIKSTWLEQYGGYDPSFKISADYRMCLDLFSEKDLKYSYVPSVLMKMRVGGVSNGSYKSFQKKYLEDMRALQSHKNKVFSPFLTLIIKRLRKLRQFLL